MTINWPLGFCFNLGMITFFSIFAYFTFRTSLDTHSVLMLWCGLYSLVCAIFITAVTFNIGRSSYFNNFFTSR